MLQLGWRCWVTDLCSSMEVAYKSLIASFLKASAQRQNSLHSKMPSLSCINAVTSVYKRASWKTPFFLLQAFACQCQSTLMLWTLRSTSGMHVFEWPLFLFCHTIYPSSFIPSFPLSILPSLSLFCPSSLVFFPFNLLFHPQALFPTLWNRCLDLNLHWHTCMSGSSESLGEANLYTPLCFCFTHSNTYTHIHRKSNSAGQPLWCYIIETESTRELPPFSRAEKEREKERGRVKAKRIWW